MLFSISDKTTYRHLLRQVAGWFFLVLGVAGLVLPVLQGLLFIAIGVALLAPYIPLFKRLQAMLHRRFPKLEQRLHAFRLKFHKHNPDANT